MGLPDSSSSLLGDAADVLYYVVSVSSPLKKLNDFFFRKRKDFDTAGIHGLMHTVLADTEAILHRIWAHACTLPTLVRINAFVLDLETVPARASH